MVRYVGSNEHKSYPSDAGPAGLRSGASRCPTHVPFDNGMRSELERAIDEGIAKGWVFPGPEVDPPRKVWGHARVGDPARAVTFCARLTNRSMSEYKAWPISEDEDDADMPAQVRRALWGDA